MQIKELAELMDVPTPKLLKELVKQVRGNKHSVHRKTVNDEELVRILDRVNREKNGSGSDERDPETNPSSSSNESETNSRVDDEVWYPLEDLAFWIGVGVTVYRSNFSNLHEKSDLELRRIGKQFVRKTWNHIMGILEQFFWIYSEVFNQQFADR